MTTFESRVILSDKFGVHRQMCEKAEKWRHCYFRSPQPKYSHSSALSPSILCAFPKAPMRLSSYEVIPSLDSSVTAPVSAGFQRRTSCASGCGAPRYGCARAAGPPGLWSWAGRCCFRSLWAASPHRQRPRRRRLWTPEPPGRRPEHRRCPQRRLRRHAARCTRNATTKQASFHVRVSN